MRARDEQSRGTNVVIAAECNRIGERNAFGLLRHLRERDLAATAEIECVSSGFSVYLHHGFSRRHTRAAVTAITDERHNYLSHHCHND